MTFTTEDLDPLDDVDAAALAEILESDSFGKFAILASSEEVFLQVGNDWQPGEACRAFLRERGSDPWILEYRDGEKQFRASGRVTLAEVLDAFRSYLAGGKEWLAERDWTELEL